MCYIVNKKIFCWYLRFDLIFRFTKYYKIQKKALNILHSTTENIIKHRKQELATRKESEKNENKEDEFCKFHVCFKETKKYLFSGTSVVYFYCS